VTEFRRRKLNPSLYLSHNSGLGQVTMCVTLLNILSFHYTVQRDGMN